MISLSWSPGLRGLFYSPAVPPGLSVCKCGTAGSASHHIVGSASCSLAFPAPQSITSLCSPAPTLWRPLHPGCPSLPLLLVWMNVSSLSPWSSDFHTVRFSVSSGVFLFLNCCCPSSGCARRQCVYQRLHLGRKPLEHPIFCIIF